MVKVGDTIPEATLKRVGESGIEDVPTKDLFSGRKVVLFGVPGAYTPTCSQQHLPGYIQNAEAFRSKGVDAIACMAVNDPFVMKAWGASEGADNKVILLSDGNAELTKAMGLDFDGSGAGLGLRCKRFAMLVDNGVIKALQVEDSPGVVERSGAEKLLEEI